MDAKSRVLNSVRSVRMTVRSGWLPVRSGWLPVHSGCLDVRFVRIAVRSGWISVRSERVTVRSVRMTTQSAFISAICQGTQIQWNLRHLPGAMNHCQDIDLIRFDLVYEAIRFFDYFANIWISKFWYNPSRFRKNGNLFRTLRQTVDDPFRVLSRSKCYIIMYGSQMIDRYFGPSYLHPVNPNFWRTQETSTVLPASLSARPASTVCLM